MRLTGFILLAALPNLSIAAYNLVDHYVPYTFFDNFNFFTDPDPSGSYVNYLSRAEAQAAGLIWKSTGGVRIGVDSTSIAEGRGRKSVRIESKKTYLHGLIIADISHMPAAVCGVWPAFWTNGATWPDDGEFDIVEGVNTRNLNLMVGHTTSGCRITDTGAFSGQLISSNCDINAPGQPMNQGCSIQGRSTRTYGNGFNNFGGGIYAVQWTSTAISVWFFSRGYIPSNVQSAQPDPAQWGRPLSQFTGACDIDRFFHPQRLIFNTAFCGPWANYLWPLDGCSQKAATCEEYVKNHPADFANAYWIIKSLKVYQ